MANDVRRSVHADAVRVGFLEGDVESVRMVSESYPLPVRTGLLGAFGEQLTSDLTPVVQIDAVYGLRSVTDTEVFTATGGTATASNGLFTCTTGTNVGGYGLIRSQRVVRYRPGQGARFRFTALYSGGPVANSMQLAGAFNAYDGLFVGYYNNEFGFMRRIAGAAEIRTLTLTVAASGGETATVTLNGTGTNVSLTGGGTTTDDAKEIAATAFTGWNAYQNGATVVFVATDAAAKENSFTYSSSSSTGSFAQDQAGAANDNDTGWVAQTNWNIDTFDGTGPSRITLDPTKLNVFDIGLQYLGGGDITLSIEDPTTGKFLPAHAIQYTNANTTPSLRNPTLRLGWFAASLGSTTDLTVQGASGAGYIEGPIRPFRNPRGAASTQGSVTTEVNVLSLRNRAAFGGTVNQSEVIPLELTAALASGSKPGEVRVYVDTALSDPSWSYIDEDNSIVEKDESDSTVSGGRLIFASALAAGSDVTINLKQFEIRLERTETITVTATVVGGAGSDVSVAVAWLED